MHRNQYLIDICIMEGCTVLEDSCIECGTPEDWESAMDEPLWSDERIITAISECVSSDRDGAYLVYEEVENVVKKLRDDYEQNIEQLETENERLHAQQSGEISELVKANRESIDALHELFDLRAENERLRAFLTEARGREPDAPRRPD